MKDWVLYRVESNGSYECDSWTEIYRSQDIARTAMELKTQQTTNANEWIEYAMKYEL